MTNRLTAERKAREIVDTHILSFMRCTCSVCVEDVAAPIAEAIESAPLPTCKTPSDEEIVKAAYDFVAKHPYNSLTFVGVFASGYRAALERLKK